MAKFPYYTVDIIKGRFVKDGMKSETKDFFNADLEKARYDALQFALTTLKEASSSFDDPSFVKDTPALIPMLEAFSVSVSFVTNENEYNAIYGEDVHETLFGLATEAFYYLQKGLINKDELVKVLQNRNDDEHEAFVLANSTEEIPEFEFDVINVLPNNLNEILSFYNS